MIGAAILRNDNLVNEVLVQVGHLFARERLEFGHRTDANHIRRIFIADPHRQAGTPETVTRDVPVLGIAQPVTETVRPHGFRLPMHAGIVFDQTVMQIFHLDIPSVNGAVDQRRVGAVAEGIRMNNGRLMDQLAIRLQFLDDVLVAILTETATPGFRSGCHEGATFIHRVFQGDARCRADAEVVFTIGRSVVHKTRTIGRGDVIVGQYHEGIGLILIVREDGFVTNALERFTSEGIDDVIGIGLLEDRTQTCLSQDIDRAISLITHGHIGNRGASADREVRQERPRRRGPDQQVSLFAPSRRCTRGDTATHRHGRILHILIVIARFKVGQRRRQLPRIRHDAVATIDAPLVPQLLEDPPHTLHEGGLHGLVIVIKVNPAAHTRNRVAPLFHITQHHRTALFVKGVNTVLADFIRTAHTQRILSQCFNRQAMTVPTETAFYIVTTHRLITRHHVLNRTSQQVTVVRQPRGKGRTIVKTEDWRIGALLQTLCKRALFGPLFQDCFFILCKVRTIRNWLKHSYP